MKTVRYEQGKLPPLTPEQIAEIRMLAAQPDETIHTDDIPPLSDEQWTHALRGQFYKPIKLPTTVRIDADVLAWLKNQGKGYQTRINAILRAAMLKEVDKR